ncbi:MAG: hypothetical protein JSW73_03380 [Candidatus Woesearchaeota archaeon]|nr:MAG: hypothetical protein JSW73_03380 [Candidatus Woesearchaeota archaeon]
MKKEDIPKIAKYEVGWWQAHHKKDWDKIVDFMAKEYSHLYEIPYKNAVKCVNYRIKAGREHDIAEKLEDEGKPEEAKVHWNKALGHMVKHFQTLCDKVNTKN